MIQRVIISMRFGWNIVEFLHEKPESAGEMIENIVHKIEANSKLNLNEHQVIVILGKLDNDADTADEMSFWRRRTLAWSHYYVISDDSRKVTQAIDNKIKKIVQKESESFLNKYHLWEATPF